MPGTEMQVRQASILGASLRCWHLESLYSRGRMVFLSALSQWLTVGTCTCADSQLLSQGWPKPCSLDWLLLATLQWTRHLASTCDIAGE